MPPVHMFGPMMAGGAFIAQLVMIAGTIFWIWALIDCLRSPMRDGAKIGWLLVIFFTHWVGALLYLVFGRPRMTHYIHPYQRQQQSTTYYQRYTSTVYVPPTPVAPPQERAEPEAPPIASYEEGYQGQAQSASAEARPVNNWQQYEEPLATYPELPRQEMQQQQQQEQ